MLFGHHTTDELNDIVAAKDAEVAMLAQLRASHPQIASADPSWDHDYAGFKARWEPARKTAEIAIQTAKYNLTVPDSLIPAEDAYQGILRAVWPVPNTVTPGSLGDLSQRLAKVGGRPPQGWQVPQPKSDGLRSANAAVKTIQDVAAAPFEGLADMTRDAARGSVHAVGKLAKAPAEGVGQALGIPWWAVMILGAGGAGVLVYLLYRGARAAAPVALRVAEVATPQGRAVGVLRAASAALGSKPSAFQERVSELRAAGG